MTKRVEVKSRGPELFKKVLFFGVILWFYVNIANFINLKFFAQIFGVENFSLSIIQISFISIFLSLFFALYSNKLEKIIFLNREQNRLSFKEAFISFNQKLHLFEKIMYLFLMLVFFISLTTFFEVISLYVAHIAGITISIVIFILLVIAVVYYICLLFKSQTFLKERMSFIDVK